MKEYPKLNEALANILRSRREELKLSKRKLAELAYLERTYVIQLEQGKKRPTLNALYGDGLLDTPGDSKFVSFALVCRRKGFNHGCHAPFHSRLHNTGFR